MATLLDIGLLNVFGIIFPFLFIWAATYAMLQYTKIFTDSKNIHALIATMLAFMTLFSRIAVKTINAMAPWFVLLFIAVMFALLVFGMFGSKEADFTKALKDNDSGLRTWIIALILIIAIGSLATVISEEKGFKQLGQDGQVAPAPTEGAPSETGGFFGAILNTKVLGMALVLLIGFFTVNWLTQAEGK